MKKFLITLLILLMPSGIFAQQGVSLPLIQSLGFAYKFKAAAICWAT